MSKSLLPINVFAMAREMSILVPVRASVRGERITVKLEFPKCALLLASMLTPPAGKVMAIPPYQFPGRSR